MIGKPAVIQANEGENCAVVGDKVRILADAQTSGGAYEIFEFRGIQNSQPPLHSHPWAEAYAIIEGELELVIDGKPDKVSAGGFINVPAGVVHTFRVASPTTRFLIVSSPAGASDFFREIDRE